MRSSLALLFVASACGGVASSAGVGEVGGDNAGGTSAGKSFGGNSGGGAAGGSAAGSGATASGGNGFGGSSTGGTAGSPNGGSSGASGQVVCPNTTRGPALVPAGSIAGNGFCTDRTEVTEEQFSGFLRDVGEPSAVADLLPGQRGTSTDL